MTSAADDDEIDLGELLLTWVAEWPVVLGSAFAGLALSGAYAFLLAPEEYRASAVLHALPHQFCPAVAAPCSVSLQSALENAAASALLPAAVEALEPELALLGDPFYAFDDRPVTVISVSLRMAETVRIDVKGNTATVTVDHSDETRAVALANAIAGYMQQDLATVSTREVAEAEARARRQLSTLASPGATLGQAEALIAIERSAILALLEGITEALQAPGAAAALARPAAPPADRTAPRIPLILVLGMLLGLFGGLVAALVRGRRDGTLYSVRAIGEAFRQAGLPAKALVRLDRRRPLLGWQEAWLAVGREARVAALVAAAGDKRITEAVSGLTAATVMTPRPVLDLGAWVSQPAPVSAPADPASGVRSLPLADLPEVLPALRDGDGQVLLLAPRAERDLAGLARVLAAADAAIVIVQPGQIAHGDVARLALAVQSRNIHVVVVAV